MSHNLICRPCNLAGNEASDYLNVDMFPPVPVLFCSFFILKMITIIMEVDTYRGLRTNLLLLPTSGLECLQLGPCGQGWPRPPSMAFIQGVASGSP